MIKQHLPRYIYEESEIFDAVIRSVQEEIDAYVEYVEARVLNWYLETASSKELDRIGALVGEARSGRSDDEYRVAIVARVNAITGTREVLLNIARFLTDETADVHDHAPGVVSIDINADRFGDKIDQKSLIGAINRAKVAGVHVLWNWKLFESTRDVVDTKENVRFPSPLYLQEKDTISESVDLPLSYEDVPYKEEELVEKQEELLYTLHEIPFVWDESEWDFAEWAQEV